MRVLFHAFLEWISPVALVSPPSWETALSQVLPALFRRVPLRSDLATVGSCRLSTKMMVHVSRDAGTRGVPGDGNPPRFCLECACIACANPRSIPVLATSYMRSQNE